MVIETRRPFSEATALHNLLPVILTWLHQVNICIIRLHGLIIILLIKDFCNVVLCSIVTHPFFQTMGETLG